MKLLIKRNLLKLLLINNCKFQLKINLINKAQLKKNINNGSNQLIVNLMELIQLITKIKIKKQKRKQKKLKNKNNKMKKIIIISNISRINKKNRISY